MSNKKLNFSTKRVVILAVSIFILLFGTTIFLSTNKAEAANPGDVIINEIMWMGSSATATDEWIELRNTSSSPIDLANWTIENAATNTTTTLTILASDCSTTTIAAANGTSTGYFLIANYDSTSTDSLLATSTHPQCVTTTLNLIDNYTTNGALTLKDDSENIIDQTPSTTTSPSWPGGATGTQAVATSSMARDWLPGDGTATSNWHTSIIATGWDSGVSEKGTPGSYNGYPVWGIISQLNAAATGAIYITANDLNDPKNELAIAIQNATGTYDIHLLSSSDVQPGTTTHYVFFVFRDINNDGYPQVTTEPNRSLAQNGRGYILNSEGLNINFPLSLAPTVITEAPAAGENYSYATEDYVFVAFDKQLDGESANNLNYYTLVYDSSTYSGSSLAANAWTEFRGCVVIIKGIPFEVGKTFKLNVGSKVKGLNGYSVDQNYNSISGTIIAAPDITGISPSQGKAGTEITITGNNFKDLEAGESMGDGNHKVYFAMGKHIGGGPSPMAEAEYVTWTDSEITVKVPSGAKTGPVWVKVNGIMSEVVEECFFNVLTDIHYKILKGVPGGDSISTTNARIVIGGMGGPVLHYVGDDNPNSTTSFDSGVFTISNAPSQGFNWVFDNSGEYIVGKGQELNSDATTTFNLATSTTKISGTITNARENSTIFVWADPIEGTGKDMEWREPIFVKTSSTGTVPYNVGLSATGTYMIGVSDPGFGGGSSSNPKIGPNPREINASTTSVTGIDFPFVVATRKIHGEIEKAGRQKFGGAGGAPIETFHVYAYEPKENGLNAAAQPASLGEYKGVFDLYVNPGVYIVGVGGPDLPSVVEKQIEVRADDPDFAIDTSTTTIVLIIKAPKDYIEGKVTDSGGSAIHGASVFSWNQYGPGAETFTDENGLYKMYLYPGIYNVEGFTPDHGKLTSRDNVEVVAGCYSNDTCPRVDFAVSSELAIISGTVVKNSASSSDMEVLVTDGETGYGINRTKTGTDGTFTLVVPYTPSGVTYYLHVAQPGRGELYEQSLPDFSSSYTSTTISVSVTTTIIYVKIQPKTDIPTFTKAFVEAIGDHGRGFSDKDISLASDSFRKYAIEVPRPTSGTYTYYIKGGIPGYGCLPATTTDITSGTDSKTISYSLTGFYTISGHINDPDPTTTSTNEAGGAFVWAASDSGHGGGEVATTGDFSFKLKAGTYDFGIDKKNYIGNMITELLISTSTTITTLELSPASLTISGTVYKSGVTESGAWVWATNGTGGWSGDETDGDGTFTLQVTSGDWAVRAASEGYESTNPQTVAAGSSGLSISLTDISGYSFEVSTVEPIVPKTGGIIQGEKVKIEAPAGALDAQDTNTGRMSIRKTTNIPKTNDVKALGNSAYEISVCNASGTPITILNDTITITLTYSSSDLSSAGIEQSDAFELSLGYFDSTLNKWVAIPTNAISDGSGGVIYTGTTNHLSPYAPLVPSGANPPSTPTGLTATAGNQRITLSWNASSLATKYNIYRESDSLYPYLTQVTAITYTNTGLTNGTSYSYKVSALNDDDDESAATVAVSATPVAPPGGTIPISALGDTTPPSISNIEVSVEDTTATITWQTSESSLSWLLYGTSTDYGFEEKTTSYVTSHSVMLENLSSETFYHYQIKSEDSSGNVGSYTDKTFTTLAEGEVPEEVVEEEEEVIKPISEMTIEELKAEIVRISDLIAQFQVQLLEMIEDTGQLIENLKYDDKGDQVKLLQTWLTKDSSVYPEGIVSGWFGPLTKAAVIRFQEKYASEVLSPWELTKGTGFVGSTTRAKLNSLYSGQ